MARQIVQLYRTSGTTLPTASKIYDGEICISTNASNPKLFIKKSNGEIAEFIDKKAVESTISQLQQVVEEQQRVHAAAMTELNTRLTNTINALTALQSAAITSISITNLTGATTSVSSNVATIDFANITINDNSGY